MKMILSGAAILLGAVAFANTDPNVFVPSTSVELPGQLGLFAHTQHLIYTGPPHYQQFDPPLLALLADHGPAALAGPAGFWPVNIRGAYGDSSNGSGAIAIVDAYNYPTALNDFNVFSGQFGLPTEPSTNVTASSNAVFQVVYASGTKPANNGGWAEEEALDIEWAHAMAPGAKVILVEAASTSYTDLFNAAKVAAGLPGVTQVSMSFGGSEFSGEKSYDTTFVKTGVSFFASSGDTGAVPEYPAMSPNVVQVGGTTLTLSGNTYASESAWVDGGGGTSSYEALPTYQGGLGLTKRSGPDISAVADPNTGVAVYDSTSYQGYVGWLVFGGTSVASPVCAGLANAGGAKRGGGELSWVYANTSGFHDVTTGGTGRKGRTYKFPAKVGYDLATGVGSPKTPASL